METEASAAHKMTPGERRATFSLAGIFAVRMLGLFMILPVFALYAQDFSGTTPLLLGVALSAYGLTQAGLQIPFGMLSDRIGRKPVILGGLLIFALGSIVAGLADSIHGVILGRALQGGGAVAAAVMALAADLTREEQRTKAMAVIGMSIGLSFAVALVTGPLLSQWIGLSGIFFFTAALAVGGMLILVWLVPNPVRSTVHRDTEAVRGQFGAVLANPDLLRLDLGIFLLHGILTSGFVVLPLLIRDTGGLEAARHWQVYLPVLAASVVLMVPAMLIAERKRVMKPVFLAAIAVLGAGEIWLYLGHGSLTGIVIGLVVFFTAFNLLEASLPSLVSRMAAPDSKGTAMGVYSSSQFLGVFVGGISGGALYGQFGPDSVFIFCAGLAFLWLLVAVGMGDPHHLSSYLLNVGRIDEARARDLVARLTGIPGVAEAVVVAEDGVAYLKVDRKQLDLQQLDEFSAA